MGNTEKHIYFHVIHNINKTHNIKCYNLMFLGYMFPPHCGHLQTNLYRLCCVGCENTSIYAYNVTQRDGFRQVEHREDWKYPFYQLCMKGRCHLSQSKILIPLCTLHYITFFRLHFRMFWHYPDWYHTTKGKIKLKNSGNLLGKVEKLHDKYFKLLYSA